jgi:predicted  nucleic acid-binding Zn-ribbon protein
MELFRLLGTIAVENEQANRAISETSSQAEEGSNKTSEAFKKIGSVAGGVVKAFATVGAALGGAWIAAIESTREYRTEMGKLDTAFQVAGHSSEAAKQTYSDLNAVLGDSGQATEAAQHLALLTDNEKDLSTWTNICTGVYATFGESLPIESLTEAANETAKTGELTGGLVDALNWAGIGEEEFQKKLDACSNEQERQKLIMDTLNGTYSKASEQYKKTNKDVMDAQKAQEKLTDAFSELGAIGEPILTAIKTKVAEMVTAAVPHLQNLVNKVKDLKKWIKDNQTTINNWKAAIVGITASVASFLLILKWGAIMSAAKTAIAGVRGAILLLNAAMKANIIGLIVSLIIGLVAAFVTLWKNNESFRNFWLNMWAKIKSTCGSAVGWIKDKFNDLKSALKTVKNVFGDIKDAISDKLEAAKDKVSSVIKKIKGLFPLSIGKIFSNLKIPKISVSGGKAPFGIAGKGKLPSFNVKWNAEGGILTKPTIFGISGNTFLGGGEAGDEAIAPIDLLQDYVKDAVQSENGGIIRTLIEQNRVLMDFLERIIPRVVQLDSGVLVGALVPGIDQGLSDRFAHSRRGNTR